MTNAAYPSGVMSALPFAAAGVLWAKYGQQLIDSRPIYRRVACELAAAAPVGDRQA